jgi:TetR/AcrR family transcriptional regulator, transcriptional repressor for nem operon
MDTASRALEIAQRLAQTLGFNGFSYADIADELEITKASLHYHFESKADLGLALIEQYTERFKHALDAITGDAATRLRRYAKLYEDVLVRDRMCLCGMLAAEYSTLPRSMQDALRRFFDMNDEWLTKTLDRGRAAGVLSFDGTALEAARVLTAGFEGAMLLARSYAEPTRFTTTAKRLLAQLKPTRGPVRPARRVAAHR